MNSPQYDRDRRDDWTDYGDLAMPDDLAKRLARAHPILETLKKEEGATDFQPNAMELLYLDEELTAFLQLRLNLSAIASSQVEHPIVLFDLKVFSSLTDLPFHSNDYDNIVGIEIDSTAIITTYVRHLREEIDSGETLENAQKIALRELFGILQDDETPFLRLKGAEEWMTLGSMIKTFLDMDIPEDHYTSTRDIGLASGRFSPDMPQELDDIAHAELRRDARQRYLDLLRGRYEQFDLTQVPGLEQRNFIPSITQYKELIAKEEERPGLETFEDASSYAAKPVTMGAEAARNLAISGAIEALDSNGTDLELDADAKIKLIMDYWREYRQPEYIQTFEKTWARINDGNFVPESIRFNTANYLRYGNTMITVINQQKEFLRKYLAS